MFLTKQAWRDKLDKGIVVIAQNNSTHNYVEQAIVLAMSVKKTNNIPVSIMTNDTVPKEYVKFFDKIIPIAWSDMSEDSDWKVENRWKVYHQSPYTETIVMDTDMVVTKNLDNIWQFYKNYDLFFTTTPVTYRNEPITSNYYRKFFEENNLPNIYSALYYFKKTDYSHDFFTYLELVVKNFHKFQRYLCPKSEQEFLSMDVAFAITVKLLDCESEVTNNVNNISRFVHMKPYIQNLKSPRNRWQDSLPYTLTSEGELYVGNQKQNNIFHYTEKDFITNIQALATYGELLDE